MATEETEGVIKFHLEHKGTKLQNIDIDEIDAWRSIFKQTETIGQIDGRYDGYGFGNLSQRTDAGFLISGTQTGNIERTNLDDYAEVVRWNAADNSVSSRGNVSPSSESLSHGVIYDACPQVAAVFHLHSPDIWHTAGRMGLAVTAATITYGTPEMADAIKEYTQGSELPNVLAMGGHIDGVVGYGRSLEETGLVLMRYLVAAKKMLLKS
jgi:ribulose-5-phosphate 4-epimerase/fuculose-1-phosphate aldolase